MSYQSYEGQDKVDYCLECSEKHGQTAKVLLREALERARANGPNTDGVMEKVRGVVTELTGMEDDTNTKDNEEVEQLHDEARDIRKEIYASRCEIGLCSVDILRDLSQRLDELVDNVYHARQKYDCPGCSQRAKQLGEALTRVGDNETRVAESEDYDAVEKRRKLIDEIRRKRR